MSVPRKFSSAVGLAVSMALLVLYASLFPFEGWRWPPGQSLWSLMVLPLALHNNSFDLWSNLLGYVPLGLFTSLAVRRSGWTQSRALWWAIAGTAMLAWGSEFLQQFVPGRVPSLSDWVCNLLGAVVGALAALAVHRMGWVDHWQDFRERWFSGDAAFALVLLALWPWGLLFPTPVPLGLGQVGPRLQELGLLLLADVSWAQTWRDHLGDAPNKALLPLKPLEHLSIVALGMLAPCLVAYSVVAPGWRRWVMALGSAVMACVSLALSALLNFGPGHAWAWLTPGTAAGMLVGLALATVLVPLGRLLTAGIGLIVITLLVAAVAQAPDDPYFAQSLLAWEQGRFVRFHGLSQWLGWLWPFAALTWLLTRLTGRHARSR